MIIKNAISDAKIKADIAASSFGLKVMGVKSIDIEYPQLQSPQPTFEGTRIDERTTPTTPIIAAQQEVNIRVYVIFVVGS
jgi:uncharacterized protein YggE